MPHTQPTQIVLTAAGPANAVAEHLRRVARELDAIGPHGGGYGGTRTEHGWVDHEERFIAPLKDVRLAEYVGVAVREMVMVTLAEPESEEEAE